MAARVRHSNLDHEGWAPYAILGVYLGLFPVFVALVIDRLIV